MDQIDVPGIIVNSAVVYGGESYIRKKKDPGHRALMSGASLFAADLTFAYLPDFTNYLSEQTGDYTKDVLAAGLLTTYSGFKSKKMDKKLLMEFLVALGYNIGATYLTEMIEEKMQN